MKKPLGRGRANAKKGRAEDALEWKEEGGHLGTRLGKHHCRTKVREMVGDMKEASGGCNARKK